MIVHAQSLKRGQVIRLLTAYGPSIRPGMTAVTCKCSPKGRRMAVRDGFYFPVDHPVELLTP